MFSKGIRTPSQKGRCHGYLAFDIVHAVEFSRNGRSRHRPSQPAIGAHTPPLPVGVIQTQKAQHSRRKQNQTLAQLVVHTQPVGRGNFCFTRIITHQNSSGSFSASRPFRRQEETLRGPPHPRKTTRIPGVSRQPPGEGPGQQPFQATVSPARVFLPRRITAKRPCRRSSTTAPASPTAALFR